MPLGSTLHCFPNAIALGDVNGDGKLDLVIGYEGDYAFCAAEVLPPHPLPPGYFVALGNGDGTFAPGKVTFTPFPEGVPQGLALARYHGPAKPLDIVLSTGALSSNDPPNANVYMLTGAGDGTFGSPVQVASNLITVHLLTDDFNHDGKPDLTLIAYQDQNARPVVNGGIFLYPGNGDGTFAAPTTLLAPAGAFQGAFADVNGDGMLDLLIGGGQPDPNYAGLSVLLGTADGQFASPINYPGITAIPLVGNFLADNTSSVVLSSFGASALFANQGGTSLTLTPSATSLTAGQTLTLTAALQPSLPNRPTPTGAVTFYDGQTAIGTGTLSSGAYTFTVPTLTPGAHTLSVAYSGDSNFQPNRSTAITINSSAQPPDYTVTPTATSLTIAKGQSAAVTLNLAANAGLSGAITFTCAGLRVDAACAFAPATVPLAAGQTATSTLTISTRAASAAARTRAASRSLTYTGGIAFAGLLVITLPLRRRGSPFAVLVLACACALGSAVTLSGCGGGTSSPTVPIDPGTPAGTSAVTVTATAVSGAATITHTVTLQLTVQ